MPGLAGVERYFDQRLQSGEAVQLSIDLRLQRMVEDEIAKAVKKFSAIGATAIVMDVTNGEVLAMASLPTYDANKAKTITNEALFNRATLGVYEQGSTFKIFNTAMALDSGKVTLASVFDATSPIKIDRFTINDDHPQRRPLTVPEIFTYSSNIASAKMAADVMGPEAQTRLLRQDRLPEAAQHAASRARRAALAAPLGQDQHHDHRLRARHLGDAAASGDRRGGDGERRHPLSAELREAHGERATPAGGSSRSRPRSRCASCCG